MIKVTVPQLALMLAGYFLLGFGLSITVFYQNPWGSWTIFGGAMIVISAMILHDWSRDRKAKK
jgi:hypothetical protein